MSGWVFQPLLPAAADLQAGGVVTTGQIKVWTGATWEVKPMKVWTGATWETKPVKFWNGSAWTVTPY